MADIERDPPPDTLEGELGKALHHIHEAEQDLEKAHGDEVRAERELREATEELERAAKLEHWILVNGRRRVVCANKVTFEEIVKIAFPIPPAGVDVKFTVQFTRGPEHKPSGTLIEGQSVKIRDGMEFDVTPTNRS